MFQKGIWADRPPFIKLMMLVIIVAVSVIALSMLAAILMKPIFGINVLTDPGVMTNLDSPEVIAALKFLQLANSLGMFVIPPLLFAWLVSMNPVTYLSFTKPNKALLYVLAAVVMLTALPLVNALAEINSHLKLPAALSSVEQWMKNSEKQAALITEKFLVMNSVGALIYNLLLVALIPAIGEELLFRGVLQKVFKEQTGNIHASIILTAIVFSALHMQFYGFLPRMMMGVLFGYMLYWSGSLWLPIIAHFINNGSAVITSYITGVTTETSETQPWYYGVISLLIVAGIVNLFYKTAITQKA